MQTPPEDIKQEWTRVLWKEHTPPTRATVGHKPAWLQDTSKDAPFREGGGWQSSAQRCTNPHGQGCSGEKTQDLARAGGADAPSPSPVWAALNSNSPGNAPGLSPSHARRETNGVTGHPSE